MPEALLSCAIGLFGPARDDGQAAYLSAFPGMLRVMASIRRSRVAARWPSLAPLRSSASLKAATLWASLMTLKAPCSDHTYLELSEHT